MRRLGSFGWVLAVAGCSVFAACGTTVPLSSQSAFQSGNPLSAGAGGATGLGLAPGETQGSGTGNSSGLTTAGMASTSGMVSPSGSGGIGPGHSGAAGAGPAGNQVAGGQGRRPANARSPVEVGFLVTQDIGGEAKNLGYSGLSTGDGGEEARAAVALVNSKGGIAGHPIQPVIDDINPESYSESTFQAACSQFFQDNHVSAVVSILDASVLRACAAQHDAPLLSTAPYSVDSATLQANPLLVLTYQMVVQDDAAALTDALIKEGFFDETNPLTKPVIGLVTNDDPEYSSAQGIVSAHLKAAGLALRDSFAMPPDNDNSDIALASEDGQAAALRFKSEGIDHVIFVDENGFGMSWFAVGARSDAYYPRLGLSTLEEPSLEPAVLNPQQLEGSEGIGWAPVIDTSVQNQPDLGSHGALCRTAMSKAGIDMSVAATRLAALPVCDAVFLLSAAWSDGKIGGAGFASGLAGLGSGYQSSVTFASDYARSRAAARAFRAIAYNDPCNCYLYSGPLIKLG